MADKIITPEFRADWPHVFKPQENKRDDGTVTREYSITAIFSVGTDLSTMKAAAQAVLVEKFGPDQSKWPTVMRSPFRKCSEKWKNEGGKQIIPPGYENGDAVFVNMKAKEEYKPGVVDQNVQPIIEPKDFYSGCYAIASTNAYWYDFKGNRGVGFGLRNLQKTREGEPLGGVSRPTDDFKPVAGASDAAGGGAAKSVFD